MGGTFDALTGKVLPGTYMNFESTRQDIVNNNPRGVVVIRLIEITICIDISECNCLGAILHAIVIKYTIIVMRHECKHHKSIWSVFKVAYCAFKEVVYQTIGCIVYHVFTL